MSLHKPFEGHLFDQEDFRHPMWTPVQAPDSDRMEPWRVAGLNALAANLVRVDGKDLGIIEQFCRELYDTLTSVTSMSVPMLLGNVLVDRHRFVKRLTNFRNNVAQPATMHLYTRDINVITSITDNVIGVILKANEGE